MAQRTEQQHASQNSSPPPVIGADAKTEYKRALSRVKRSLADMRDEGPKGIDIDMLETRFRDLVRHARSVKAL